MTITPLGAKGHGAADWGFAAAAFLGPSLLGLSGRARMVAYALGSVTLTVNSITDQPFSLKRLISLRTHGKLETPLLPALAIVPLVTGVLKDRNARRFFLPYAAAAYINYLITDFNADKRPATRRLVRKSHQLVAGAAERNPHHALQ